MAPTERDPKELGFFDHLDELRARIIRSVVYLTVFSAAAWAWREPLLVIIRHPAEVGALRAGIQHLPFRVFEPMGGFMVAIQISMLAGVIAAAPLILWEIWRFVEPALAARERRSAIIVLPFAVLLFAGGVMFCYYVSPAAFAFLFKIDLSLGVEPERTLQPYLWFVMRLMLGFGLAFELPLVLMFLGYIGVVTHRQLLSWWRQALVLIFVFAAVITPTMDPVNMTILAVPVFALYMVSILLVRMVERSRRAAEDAEAEEVSPLDYDIAHVAGQAETATEVALEPEAGPGLPYPELREDADEYHPPTPEPEDPPAPPHPNGGPPGS